MTKAYLIAILGTLVPSWIGSAIYSTSDINSDPTNLKMIIAICFFALSFWGTSLAFLVFKKTRYALISGIGKWLLLFTGVMVSRSIESGGHPYILVLGILFAFCWCLFDLFFLIFNRKSLLS